MKKSVFIISAVLLCHAVHAQFAVPSENQLLISRAQTMETEDITAALTAIGVEVFKFILPVDTLPAYNVILHVDQYSIDSLINSRPMGIGRTYQYFTEERGGPASRFSNALRLVCNGADADKPKISIEFIDVMRFMMQIEKKTEYPYATRPFAACPLETGVKIPLVMWGSYWKDERGIVRFCGRKELLREGDEMTEYSPHYYIFSIELQPVAE